MPTLATSTIHSASDLQAAYRRILDEAKSNGIARVRDSDGTSMVVMPERELGEWEARMAREASILAAVRSFMPLESALAEGRMPSDLELGSWTWIRSLDGEDQAEFAAEVRDALLRALDSGLSEELEGLLHDWHETALVLNDELSRSTLLGQGSEQDFIEVFRPEA